MPSVSLLTVTAAESLGPHLVRVRFSGDLAHFRASAEAGLTDRYVKLVLAPEGVTYPEPFDLQQLRRDLPPEEAPAVRTYTVRDLDVDAGTLAVDFVVHGDEGVAGPWAARVLAGEVPPGTTLRVLGPGGAYAPQAGVDHHLLVADLAGLPAVAAAVTALPSDARGTVLLQVVGPEDELDLGAPDGVAVHWLHADPAAEAGRAPEDTTLAVAVRRLVDAGWPAGRVQAFVHAEAAAVMHGVRPQLKALGVGREHRGDLSVSGYWRHGRTEDGFRVWKSELARAEQDAS